MAIKSPLTIILGAGNIGDKSLDPIARFDTPDEVKSFLSAFHARGGRHVDTARGYSPHAPGSCETRLGLASVGNQFSIDTKVISRGEGTHSREKIFSSVEDSLEALKVPSVDVEYLHMPDRTTPFAETAAAMDEKYRQGKFKRFGLSNYTAAEVEEIVGICEAKGYVKPSVYQGQYNPIVRGGEKELFPVLRKHGIAFYAWSPAAGGFFASNHKNVQKGGRFDSTHRLGEMYGSGYLKPNIEAATDKALALIAKHNINGHAAALRWTVYNSQLKSEFGDAVIIGASSVAQLNANLDMIEQGPLPEDVVDVITALYAEIEGSEFAYHF